MGYKTLFLFGPESVCVFALLQRGLCYEIAFLVIDHDSGFVVVHRAFLAVGVDIDAALAGLHRLVACGFFRASVEFVFYGIASVCDCLEVSLHDNFDVLLRGLFGARHQRQLGSLLRDHLIHFCLSVCLSLESDGRLVTGLQTCEFLDLTHFLAV